MYVHMQRQKEEVVVTKLGKQQKQACFIQNNHSVYLCITFSLTTEGGVWFAACVSVASLHSC